MFAFFHMGYPHLEECKNAQDIASTFKTTDGKVVSVACDGCSSCSFAEVGAILFNKIFRNKFTVSTMDVNKTARETFTEMLKLISNNNDKNIDSAIESFLLFTILICVERDDKFEVFSCGDGIIISIDNEDTIEYSILGSDDVENVPKYLCYDFYKDKSKLSSYQDGVDFVVNTYSKDKYKRVGVGSDGIRTFLTSYKNDLRIKFEKYILQDGKEAYNNINEMVKQYHNQFDDDICLAIN